MIKLSSRFVKRLYPHNPAYVISAWLVLHGLRLTFGTPGGLEGGTLLTSLLCGYTLALAGAGVLVARAAKLWEDARTILLVVLLMFTALSVSFDELCQKDPVAGLENLAAGFLFSCLTTEIVLWLLSIRLPLSFRAPLYLQLAVLFAFPPWLGRLSIDGLEQALSLGVVGFSVASGLSLLALLPGTRVLASRLDDNGTPWRWPYFPWSIFVFMALAQGVRAWMLSYSFSQGLSALPAFHLLLLCPILFAVGIVVLELGLRSRSYAVQRVAVSLVVATMLLGMTDATLNPAQAKLLQSIQATLSGPATVLASIATVICAYAMLRRASWAEPATLVCLALSLSFPEKAVSIQSADLLSHESLSVFACWLVVRGAWSMDLLRISLGGAAGCTLAVQLIDVPWATQHHGFLATHAALAWLALAPLICRDALAAWLRTTSPLWTLLTVTWSLVASPSVWRDLPPWHAPVLATTFCAIGLLYWVRTKQRWCLAAAGLSAALTSVGWTYSLLDQLDNPQLRHGMRWYATGCLMLAVGLMVSLIKSGVSSKLLDWLSASTPAQHDTG